MTNTSCTASKQTVHIQDSYLQNKSLSERDHVLFTVLEPLFLLYRIYWARFFKTYNIANGRLNLKPRLQFFP